MIRMARRVEFRMTICPSVYPPVPASNNLSVHVFIGTLGGLVLQIGEIGALLRPQNIV